MVMYWIIFLLSSILYGHIVRNAIYESGSCTFNIIHKKQGYNFSSIGKELLHSWYSLVTNHT